MPLMGRVDQGARTSPPGTRRRGTTGQALLDYPAVSKTFARRI